MIAKITNVSILLIILCVLLLSVGILVEVVWPDETDRLDIELMPEAPSQPWVTFNRLAEKIDALVQPTVARYPANASPTVNNATDGDVFIVPPNAEGDWNGKDGQLAISTDSVLGFWEFVEPDVGWEVSHATRDFNIAYNGEKWGPKDTLWASRLYVSNATEPPASDNFEENSIVIDATSGLLLPNTQTLMSLNLNNKNHLKVYFQTTVASGTRTYGNHSQGQYGRGTIMTLGRVEDEDLDGFATDDAQESIKLDALYGEVSTRGRISAGRYASTADAILDVSGAVNYVHVDDPPDPAIGESVEWYDSNGDKKAKINVGGTVKTTTLIDYSGLP
jgi:hypothetical protein